MPADAPREVSRKAGAVRICSALRTCGRAGLPLPPLRLVTVVLCLAALPVRAGETVISLKNIAFQPLAVTVEPGEQVTFVNNDPIPHNVYSTTSPATFDLGLMRTGQRKSVQYQSEGVYEILCSVHSNMTLRVTVKRQQGDAGGKQEH